MKQLKQRSFLFMLFLPVVAGLGLTSCSGDDLESDPRDDNSRFYVSIADAGYRSASEGIHTKSSEQGYTTEFTVGDQIGVFAVKNNQIITEVSNLCLTATENNATLVWKDTGGNPLLKFDGAVYYAYYPYQSSLTGTLVLTATDASGFFANVVSNWTPSTDQGVYTKYTAQDLMTAKGVISNTELSFTMQHEMVLAVIELPGTKYEFSNTNPTVSDYIIDPLDSQFDNYRPYKMTDGTYRYLVKPGSTNKLTGSYTNASNAAKGWEANPAGISFGSYKTFKVDGGIANVISGYNLQVGDYMLKDGTLVSKDATLNSTQRTNCIGIVFWIDPDGISHGKIVSLDQSTNTYWSDYQNTVMLGTTLNDGLVNIQLVADYIRDNNKSWGNFPIFEWIHNTKNGGNVDYGNTTTTLWYLPSLYELEHLFCAYNGKPFEIWENYNNTPSWGPNIASANAAFNLQLTNAGGTQFIGTKYRSSSEDGTGVYCINFSGGFLSGVIKDYRDQSFVVVVIAKF